MGGGTDLEDFYINNGGGAVVSTTIDKYIDVIIKKRFDDKIVLNYSKKEIVDDVRFIDHELIREAMKITGVTKGVEITTLADIPSEGTGLGSSSSVTVGLLQALFAYQNKIKDSRDLANLACEIEIEKLGKPIGRQDQFIAAFGGLRLITFNYGKIEVKPIKCDKKKLGDNLLMFYTGITRRSSDILSDQKERINEHIYILKEMRVLAFMGKECLESGDYDDFGVLLNANWILKKQLSDKISNPQIDDIYNTGLKAGAVSGKILGGGAGGFMLFYVKPEKQESVRQALHGLQELPITLTDSGSKIIFDCRR